MLERDEVCFDTRTVKQPFAGQLAAADGDTSLHLLVAFIELNRWVVQIIDRCEALDLIFAENKFPQHGHGYGDKRAEQNEIAQLHTAAEAHAQEHEEKNDRGAVITLNMAEQNGHRRVEREQNDVQRVIDFILHAQNGDVLCIGQHKADFHKLARLERAARKADPRARVDALAALHADAEKHGVEHDKNGKTRDEIPERRNAFVIDEGKHKRREKARNGHDELRFEIIRVHRAGNAFQKNKAERGYCEHQKPKKLVRAAEKGRNSKENAAVFRKITCFQKNQKKPK